MTNFNDDDIDLGLALGCTTSNNVEKKRKDDSLGAGVNASTTVDTAFAASDPLSELVWSPHKGLSLKWADNSLADKKPFLLWNVGPSTLIASSSQSDRFFKGTYDENAAYEKIIDCQERFRTNVMGSKSGKAINIADGVDMLDTNRDDVNVKKSFCVTQDIAQTVESCENHAGKGDFGTERSPLNGASSKIDMETTDHPAGKINEEISTSDKCRKGNVKDSEALACSPAEKEADKTLESTGLPALECTAENDINETCDENEEQLLKDSSVPPETSPTHSRSSSYRRKGKGKALLDENANSKMLNDEEDSHESVESCNSTRLIPKGNKRWHFEQQFFVGSKRIRTDMRGDPVARESTTVACNNNSSFVTWISNMVKGFSKSNLEESSGPTLALTLTPNDEENHGKEETNQQEFVGFQSVFQSLYCPKEENKILIDVPPISCHRGGDDMLLDAPMISTSARKPMQTPPVVSPPQEASRTTSAENKGSSDMSNRNQSLRSLWITRFSNKTPGSTHVMNIDNYKPNTHATLTSIECRIEHESSDERSMSNLHRIIPSAKFNKSEALASLFARRLDALKHIKPSSTSYARTTTCFFCGKSGHDLRNCLEVTESEMEVLIRSIGSYDGAEESSCLCIRCFQLDHWAISCPTSTSKRSQQLEHNVGNECLPSLLEIANSDLMHNRKQFWFAITSGSKQVQKQITSEPTENSVKENIISSNIVSKELIADVPKGIFDVIRGLRLSRVDILKWMNSNTSLSHLDGFFLRLRLGKWEAGLGGTGYYVACISGLKGEKLERDSKNCIYVNVCGVKCFVGSQYVSNQDFLEDELTTWWRKSLESGWKVPTEGDLRLKLEERTKLGF